MKRPKQLPLFVLEDGTGNDKCPVCHARPSVIWLAQKYAYYVHPSMDICIVERVHDPIPWGDDDDL